MKAAMVLTVAAMALVGCAREERWTLSSDGSARPIERTAVADMRGPAYRSVKLIETEGGYALRNTSNLSVIATLQIHPVPQQGPLADETQMQVLVPAGSEVRVGSHEYRVISAVYK